MTGVTIEFVEGSTQEFQYHFVSNTPYNILFHVPHTYTCSCVLFFHDSQNLLSTTGFGMACKYLARWEEQGDGAQWSNYYKSPMPGDDYSLGTCVNMMLLDAFLYFVILWYVENVMPGKQPISISQLKLLFIKRFSSPSSSSVLIKFFSDVLLWREFQTQSLSSYCASLYSG